MKERAKQGPTVGKEQRLHCVKVRQAHRRSSYSVTPAGNKEGNERRYTDEIEEKMGRRGRQKDEKGLKVINTE